MLNPLFDLTGRAALVTGGSKGIGKAIARALAEAGANVAISARHEDELQKAAAEIGQGLDVQVAWRVADMGSRPDTDALAQWALTTLGRVDILFNNAGSNSPEPLATADRKSVV